PCFSSLVFFCDDTAPIQIYPPSLHDALPISTHGLLAHVLHIEGCLALALGGLHARVEGAQRHHVAQALQKLVVGERAGPGANGIDRKSTRLNSSHVKISYAVFCLKKKNNHTV